MLTELQRWVDPKIIEHWFKCMFEGGDRIELQGLGEILVIRRNLFPEEVWVSDMLDSFLSIPEGGDGFCSVRVGIAHSVAHLWGRPSTRNLVSVYLLVLLKIDDEDVLRALTYIFHSEYFLPDEASKDLMDCLIETPRILYHQQAESIVSCLVSLVNCEPNRVFQVCNIILKEAGEDMGSMASSRYIMSDSLLVIAMELQDMGLKYQDMGTSLFEQMLEFNIPQANDLVLDLDKRLSY